MGLVESLIEATLHIILFPKSMWVLGTLSRHGFAYIRDECLKSHRRPSLHAIPLLQMLLPFRNSCACFLQYKNGYNCFPSHNFVCRTPSSPMHLSWGIYQHELSVSSTPSHLPPRQSSLEDAVARMVLGIPSITPVPRPGVSTPQ